MVVSYNSRILSIETLVYCNYAFTITVEKSPTCASADAGIPAWQLSETDLIVSKW